MRNLLFFFFILFYSIDSIYVVWYGMEWCIFIFNVDNGNNFYNTDELRKLQFIFLLLLLYPLHVLIELYSNIWEHFFYYLAQRKHYITMTKKKKTLENFSKLKFNFVIVFFSLSLSFFSSYNKIMISLFFFQWKF